MKFKVENNRFSQSYTDEIDILWKQDEESKERWEYKIGIYGKPQIIF